MNKHLLTQLTTLAIFGCFSSAQAATLTAQLPGNSSVYTTTVGSFFDANIYVDALPDFAAFDFNLTYNSTNLSAETLASGSIFGADTYTFANTITPGVGTIHFAEALSGTSLLETGLNITAPTLLGTVKFKALKTNLNNPLNITSPILYSFDGTSLSGTLQGANVTINPVAAVPLPASFLLMGTGLLGFAANRWSQLKQKLS